MQALHNRTCWFSGPERQGGLGQPGMGHTASTNSVLSYMKPVGGAFQARARALSSSSVAMEQL